MEIQKAKTLRDALEMLSGGTRPAAGCTNILVDLRRKGEPGFDYADISGIEELKGIRENGGKTEIGAGVSFAEAEGFFRGKKGFEALLGAASEMGSPQIRNRATLGGNICDASPACDAGPALLALNAAALAVSLGGEREIAMEKFFLGARKTALLPGELLRCVTVPEGPVHSAWRKVGLRNALAISVVSLAACRYADGRVLLAMGSVSPRPVRLYHCEGCIAAGKTDRAALAEALSGDIAPISDIRAGAEYRKKAALNLLADVLEKEFGYDVG